jgi:serine/threonine protein kinase
VCATFVHQALVALQPIANHFVIVHRLGSWQQQRRAVVEMELHQVLVAEVRRGFYGELGVARGREDQSFVRCDEFSSLLEMGVRAAGDFALYRFEQERQTLARLEHEHIVAFLDAAALADGRTYVVMEYVGGVPKLVDFGVASVLGSNQTAKGIGPMTPVYASPEQLAGDLVTVASDVFALGVVLREMLSSPHD